MIGLTARDFSKEVGIAYSYDLLKSLRDNGQVNFFSVGRKFIYPKKEVESLKKKIMSSEISIKTNKGKYYITVN